MAPGDYIRAAAVPNFRAAWEALGEEAELADDYGLGERENLQVPPPRNWLSAIPRRYHL